VKQFKRPCNWNNIFFCLKELLVFFPFWHASQILSLLNLSLGKPITRSLDAILLKWCMCIWVMRYATTKSHHYWTIRNLCWNQCNQCLACIHYLLFYQQDVFPLNLHWIWDIFQVERWPEIIFHTTDWYSINYVSILLLPWWVMCL